MRSGRPGPCLERRRQMQEYNRLLYVALTRAEDRLVVCGWQTRKPVPDTSWYSLVARGFAQIGATPEPFAGDWGMGLARARMRADRPDPLEPGDGRGLNRAIAIVGRAARRLAPCPAAAGAPLPVPLAPQPPRGRSARPGSRRPFAAAARRTR